MEPSQGIVVVADGMGGAPGGDVASALAVQEVVRGLHGGEGMEESVRRANRKILEMTEARPTLAGMGTTLTALKVSAGGRDLRPWAMSGIPGPTSSRRTISPRSPGTTPWSGTWWMPGKIPPSAEREHPLGHILSRVLGTERDVEVDLIEGVAEGRRLFPPLLRRAGEGHG